MYHDHHCTIHTSVPTLTTFTPHYLVSPLIYLSTPNTPKQLRSPSSPIYLLPHTVHTLIPCASAHYVHPHTTHTHAPSRPTILTVGNICYWNILLSCSKASDANVGIIANFMYYGKTRIRALTLRAPTLWFKVHFCPKPWELP